MFLLYYSELLISLGNTATANHLGVHTEQQTRDVLQNLGCMIMLTASRSAGDNSTAENPSRGKQLLLPVSETQFVRKIAQGRLVVFQLI